MNVLEKAEELRQNTNAAARAVALPFRLYGPPPRDLFELLGVLGSAAAVLLLRAFISRVIDGAIDAVQEAIWPRRPAPVLRLVVRE